MAYFDLLVPEFIEFVKYLRSPEGKSEITLANDILNNILYPEGLVRGEYLDARFEKTNGLLYVYEENIFSEDNVILGIKSVSSSNASSRKIDFEDWLNQSTHTGLPCRDVLKGDLTYYVPQGSCVASFYELDGLRFDCVQETDYSEEALGVRAVREVPK